MKDLVWIIDDDAGILEVTEIVLNDAGFSTKKISTQQELDSELKKQLPKVILLDVTLAGIDGIEIAKKLKNNSMTKKIPIIMMSGDASIEQKAKSSGVDDYIKKPFDIYKLQEIVKKHSGL